VVVDAISKKHSKSESVRGKLKEFFELLHELKCTVIPQYLPGSENIIADNLSRVSLEDQYRLNPDVLQLF
jgi:hypothetical protein